MAIQRYGYFVLAQANFKKFMNERLEWASTQIQPIVPNVTLPSNAQQMLDILEQSKGSLWPLRPGPPVRRMQSKVCIDLEAATMQLNNLLYFFPTGGKPDNFRGQHFEIAVQKIIDASSWCPPENIKRIRGLPLRHSSRGKNAVTDIDALGVREDILLIVSCKSIPYSEYYDAGDYSAVRSAISTIQEAVKQWNEIKTFLERNPTGNNYDLSDYRQIIAVVCTPHVYYAPLGQPTYFIASGLCAAVSYQELKTWLSAPEQESLGNANISSQ